MRYSLLLIILLTGFFLATPVWSTSLFDEDGCDLFTVDSAANIGDLVTIVISESTKASNMASTDTSKSLNTD
ncbi:MAG: flagellar basal body L-ring protein FlgH, partial [bacterium]